jgi:hypothetical protein
MISTDSSADDTDHSETLTEGNQENEDSMKGASAEDSPESIQGYNLVPFVVFCKKWDRG